MTHAIAAHGLRKAYPPDVEALGGLDLTVPAGTVAALLGPNGAGKSTAVRILTTLARADAGETRVAGHDVVGEPAAVRRAIGVVGQRPGFDPAETARENVAMQAALHGLRGRACREATVAALRRCGLDEGADRTARKLSGGTQRRLDLAMALVHRPRVLFLDEPTTGLDPEVRAALWREIEALSAQEGMTVLLTTHYLEEADRLAASVTIIDRGRVVAAGTPDALKRELDGDAVVVELADGGGSARALACDALGQVPGLRELSGEAATIRARAADGARAVPTVLAALDAVDVGVAAVTVSRPSLDDVYLRHTGHSLEEAA